MSNIDRILTWLPETYIIVYKISDNNKNIILRGNASKKISRRPSYQTIKHLSEHNLSDTVPWPIVFIEEYNLILYKNIDGTSFLDQITNHIKTDKLKKEIIASAEWLARFHRLNFSLPIPNYEFQFFYQLENYYPNLYKNIETIKKENLSKIKTKKIITLHGDYKPDNIIFDQAQIKIFDFNETSLGNPMIDVASFLTQTKVMLMRFYDIELFKSCERIFLENYNNICKITSEMQNDLEVYKKIYYLKILSWLSAILPEDEPDKNKTLKAIYTWYNET